jgi:hypothetical protein
MDRKEITMQTINPHTSNGNAQQLALKRFVRNVADAADELRRVCDRLKLEACDRPGDRQLTDHLGELEAIWHKLSWLRP